ncbi:MAG: hypothetical protein RLP44_01440 [Aggregatilineales bacterium]
MQKSEATVTTQSDFVYALGASPSFQQDGICFAAKQSGLYRSQDGGIAWDYCFNAFRTKSLIPATAIVISPTFDSDRTLFVGTYGGILNSTDGGDSWEFVPLPSPAPIVTALEISPNYHQDGIVLAATLEDGVFRSINRGAGWVSWNFGLLDWRVHCITISPQFAQDETVIIGTESGLFQSKNGGRMWQEVASPVIGDLISHILLTAQFTSHGELLIATEDGKLYQREKNDQWEKLEMQTSTEHIQALISFPPQLSVSNRYLVFTETEIFCGTDSPVLPVKEKYSGQDLKGITCALAVSKKQSSPQILLGTIDGNVRQILLSHQFVELTLR